VKLAAEVADLSEDMRSIMSAGVDDVIERIAGLIDLGKQDQSIQADTEASTLAQVLYQMWLGAALLSKLQKDKTPLHQALRATTDLVIIHIMLYQFTSESFLGLEIMIKRAFGDLTAL